MIIIGIDPGLTGGIAIFDTARGFVRAYDMPTQVASIKRKRVKSGKLKGQMKDYPQLEVSAVDLAHIIHPTNLGYPAEGVKVYIERVGAVYRADQQGGTDAHQPLHATFVFGEGAGVLRGVCEAYYGPDNVTRVAPITWKKHFDLVKTEKDTARLKAIELLPETEALLKRKKDIGRADATLIGLYGVHQEQEK